MYRAMRVSVLPSRETGLPAHFMTLDAFGDLEKAVHATRAVDGGAGPYRPRDSMAAVSSADTSAALGLAGAGIPLGPLDGRYRACVAPLVDHLSEAALNRERVHVEVEWLIHLTEPPGRARASAALTDDEQARAAATSSTTSAPTRSPSWPRSSARRSTTSRPSSTSSSGGSPRSRRRGGPRARRADPLLLHQRGHQQPVLRADGQGRRRRRCGCRAATALVDDVADDGPELRDVADAGPHPRPARHADDAGQGAGGARPPAAAPAAPGRAAPSTSASSTAPPARTARTSPPCRAPTGRRVSRAFVERLGPGVEPAHHPDRVARLAGRALRRRRPVQPGAAQPVHRRLDLHLARLLRAGPRRRAPSGSSTMPHKVNPIRFENAEANLEVSQRAARRARLDPGDQPAAARPHRLLDAAQHRHRRSATRCWRSTTCARGLAGLDAVPAAMARRPRRQLGGARRAGAVGDARARRRACPAWRTRTSGSRS